MASSTHLFDLIKSMSKPEKRHFKLYSAKYDSNKTYLLLFDAIEKQSQKASAFYDENAIKKKFRNEPFIRQLTFTKNYLYNTILNSLEIFYQDYNMKSILFGALRRIDLLMKRNLFSQAETMIKKYKKFAAEYEYRELHSLFIMAEIECEKTTFFPKRNENAVHEHRKNWEELIENMKYENNLDLIHYQLQYHTTHATNDKAGVEKKIRDLLNSKKHTGLSKPTTFNGKYFQLLIQTTYQFYIENFKGAYEYSVKSIKMIHQYPHIQKEMESVYISALHNKLICEARLKLFKEFDETIVLLRKIKTPILKYKRMILYSMYGTGSFIYSENGNIEMGVPLCRDIESKERTQEFLTLSNNQKLLLYHNMASIFFCASEYSSAIKYLNKVLNNKSIDKKSTIFVNSRLLNILTHFQLGHEDLLEYLTRSAYRSKERLERLSGFEKIVLDFVRKNMTRVQPEKLFLQQLSMLNEQVMEKKWGLEEKKIIEESIFMKWARSKIEGKPLPQYLKESASIN